MAALRSSCPVSRSHLQLQEMRSRFSRLIYRQAKTAFTGAKPSGSL
ncbi:MAG: hypothetical protein M3O33_05210 [Cyanobacteriota bacterium]|nr:hypothetical protein [Cyanobacteriota bacterium]